MHYYQARPLIQSGNVIGIATRGPLSPFTRAVQWLAGFGPMSEITHVGVAKWIDGHLYLVEMDGVRNVLCRLSQYSGRRMYVFARPVPEIEMAAQFDTVIGRLIKYSYFDLLRIGVRMVFRLRARRASVADKDEEMVCSNFVLAWLMLSGWVPPETMPSEPSPCELCAALDVKFMIDEGADK